MSVDFSKGKWRARIMVNGKRRGLGSFSNRKDAQAAYDAACAEAEKVRVRKSQVEDLTGLRFGKLTVVSLNPVRHKGSSRWDCRCECGRRVTIRVGDLKVAKTCGCESEGLRLDLTGMRFGRWTAIRYVPRAKPSRWMCRCECGTERSVTTVNLTCGSSLSCGCYNIERHTTHGLSGTREIGRWYAAQRRARLLAVGGSHTIEEVNKLWRKQNGLCAACAVDLTSVKPELDHIVALSRGGDNSIANLQWLCKPCNRSKHARPMSVLTRRAA